MNGRNFRHALGRVRNHVVGAYSTARKWAGAFDDMVGVASRIHGAIRPLLDESSVGRAASSYADAGMQRYKGGKESLMQQHKKASTLQFSLMACRDALAAS